MTCGGKDIKTNSLHSSAAQLLILRTDRVDSLQRENEGDFTEITSRGVDSLLVPQCSVFPYQQGTSESGLLFTLNYESRLPCQ